MSRRLGCIEEKERKTSESKSEVGCIGEKEWKTSEREQETSENGSAISSTVGTQELQN